MKKTKLKEISKLYEINDNNLNEEEIIKKIRKKLKFNGEKYAKICQLGVKGKDANVFMVINKKNKVYAMKKFRQNKSKDKFMNEIKLQKLASRHGITPQIIDYNTDKRYIIMELLDNNLLDIIQDNEGKITDKLQKDIINIIKNLDKIKIFHGDPNPLNFMTRDNTLYIIDFGFSQKINKDLIKKYQTPYINLKFMILGLLLKLQELFGTNNRHLYLRKYIELEDRNKFKI